MEELNPIAHLFKHKETLKFDTLVGNYVKDHGMSPFIDIDMSEDVEGQFVIDMENSFNVKVQKVFGDDLDKILADYMFAIIMSLKEEIKE